MRYYYTTTKAQQVERPPAPSTLAPDERAPLERWVWRPTTGQSLARRARIVLRVPTASPISPPRTNGPSAGRRWAGGGNACSRTAAKRWQTCPPAPRAGCSTTRWSTSGPQLTPPVFQQVGRRIGAPRCGPTWVTRVCGPDPAWTLPMAPRGSPTVAGGDGRPGVHGFPVLAIGSWSWTGPGERVPPRPVGKTRDFGTSG